MSILFQWVGDREQEVADGDIDWLNDILEVRLYTSAMVAPDNETALLFSDWTGQMSGTGYSAKTLAGKTVVAVGTTANSYKASPVTWTGLATAAGAARYAVIGRTADGIVLGYGTLRDADDNTDLVGGGNTCTLNIGLTTSGPGTGTGNGAATSLANSLGVAMGSPTPTKIASWETATGTTCIGLHVFGHNGLNTATSTWVSTVGGMIDSTTGVVAGRSGTILLVTSPPMQKAVRGTAGGGPAGETQAQAQLRIGQTITTVNGGANDAYFTALGAKYHEKGFDVPLGDGRKNAIQLGQEANLTAFPWYMGTDPVGAANMLVRMVDKMEEGGLDLDGVEIVVNLNTLGAASRANVEIWVGIVKTVATVLTIDWYDVDYNNLYENNQATKAAFTAQVFDGRSTRNTTTRVTAGYILDLAIANGLKCGMDEMGIVTTDIPPSNLDSLGGGADATGAAQIYMALKADWIEQEAIPTGAWMWEFYFNYDTSDGLNHKIAMSPKYPATAALAVLTSRWG